VSPEQRSALHTQPGASSGAYRVAIVGAATLKGKEVAEVLKDRGFPARDVKLLDDDESLGQLEALGDEVSFIQNATPDQFEKVDFAFFASEEKFTREHWKFAKNAGSAIVDLSYALENEPGASVRSPWVERQLDLLVAPELQPAPVVIAHPAAIVLALLVLRAQRAGALRSIVGTVFEPASEHGQKGMDELHEQTVNLLSFQQMPRNIFDTQVAFNLVMRYGEKSLPSLETVERRIVDHYRRIASGNAAIPALRLVQAPIFHGHAFSLYLEVAKPVALGDMVQALAGDHVTITRKAEDSPSNINAAGQEEILLSVTRDVNHENGFWIWAAADNLRIAASTAVECAQSMAAARPRGQIQ
jgi:aspartate-semialdehyde dehydrogenase